MPILYESHTTGDDAAYAISMTSGDAQTFTPQANHTITRVKLKLYRGSQANPPGTITVSIRDVDAGTGFPTGGDLCAGTTDGDTLTEDTGGEWREIIFTSSTPLTSGTLYAIYAWSAAISAFWRTDTDNGYANGKAVYTADGGGTWSDFPAEAYDHMFEEWGDITGGATVTTQECTDTTARTSTGHGLYSATGDSSVTQHGHCWSTSAEPTTADSKTENGASPNLGQFQSFLTGLTPNTLYYVAAYATNTQGTAYGSDVTITTGSTIGKRYIWTEGTDFHYFDAYSTERVLQGHAVASDKDILPWLAPWS